MIRPLRQPTADRVAIVTECMDELSLCKVLTTSADRKEVIQYCIDVLSNYQKPSKRGDQCEPKGETLGAYLCVSNVRNALKLGLIGVLSTGDCLGIAGVNLELALTLLLAE